MLALLLSLSVAACIKPITAASVQTGGMAVVQAAADDATEDINKAAVRGWFEAFNSHDLDGLDRAVDKYYAPDYVYHNSSIPNFTGGAATIKQLVRESLEALPDLLLTIEEMIAEGDMVAVRVTVSGTDPNNKALSFMDLTMIRFVDGQYSEEWELTEPAGEEVVGSDIFVQK